MSKKTWQLIGNIVVGILILVMGIVGFYVLPSKTLHDIEPYTGTMRGAMQALHYIPYCIPLAVALFIIGCYYRFGRNLQQTFLSLGAILLGVCLGSAFSYAFIEDGFLNQHILYEGKCTAKRIGVHTNGEEKTIYAEFSCDNDPGYVFKVWDPDIIAYVANHPNSRSAVYQLSAGDTLSPVPQR